MIAIPYLDAVQKNQWRSLSDADRARLIAASKAVVAREGGYRAVAKAHGVAHLHELFYAVANPVSRGEQPAPWGVASEAAGAKQAIAPPANLARALDATEDVIGVDVVREYIEDGRLTAQQAMAAVMLAMGETVVAVARAIRVNRPAIYQWRKIPAFAEALNNIVIERAEAMIARLDEAQTLALAVLIEGLKADTVAKDGSLIPDWPTRVRCAEALLDRGGRALKGQKVQLSGRVEHEQVAIEVRVAAEVSKQEAIEEEMRRNSAELRVYEGGRAS